MHAGIPILVYTGYGGQVNRTSYSQSLDRAGGAAGQGSVLTKLRLRDMELLLAIHEQLVMGAQFGICAVALLD